MPRFLSVFRGARKTAPVEEFGFEEEYEGATFKVVGPTRLCDRPPISRVIQTLGLVRSHSRVETAAIGRRSSLSYRFDRRVASI